MQKKILELFKIDKEIRRIAAHKIGHLHGTFFCYVDKAKEPLYVLQKLNTFVFKDIKALMGNIEIVLECMKEKASNLYKIPELIYTKKGNSYIEDEEGAYWRIYKYVPNSYTKIICKKPREAFQAGKVAGVFQQFLDELEPDKLIETIPNFHNSNLRFLALEESVNRAEKSLLKIAEAQIQFANKNKDLVSHIVDLLNIGVIPKRIIHSDLKFNNVLFDKNSDLGVSLIDLDTYMPNTILYDFGDFARSTCMTQSEDEQNLGAIDFDMAFFEALTEGYVGGLKNSLTKAEIENLYLAPRIIALTLGVRFLTDFLEGDVYFKIDRPRHNLDRAKNQFKLAEKIEEQEANIKNIIEKYV